MEKILIIDDDNQLTELLIEFLGSHKYNVIAKFNRNFKKWEAFSLTTEPLSNINNVHSYIDKLTNYQNVETVVIYTNVKIVPKGENLECLKIKKNSETFINTSTYVNSKR